MIWYRRNMYHQKIKQKTKNKIMNNMAPHAFKVRTPKNVVFTENQKVKFISSETGDALYAEYVGRSNIDRMSMFEIGDFEGDATTLADIFDGETTMVINQNYYLITEYPHLISTLEDNK